MKTAAKVFIIIGIVTGFWLIVPLIVGIIALKKLESASSHSELVGIGVVTLIFCSLLGGLFMLLVKDEDLNNIVPEVKISESKEDDSIVDKIQKLSELKKDGTISDAEFEEVKKSVIEK